MITPKNSGVFHDYDGLAIKRASRGGYIIADLDGEPVFAAADDVALIEFFAEQLVLPSPTKPGPTVAALKLDEDAFLWRDKAEAAMKQLGAVQEQLMPLADLCIALRDEPDNDTVAFRAMPEGIKASGGYGGGAYADVLLGHLRDLLRAAGLFTEEMQARPPNPGPDAKPPEAEPPVPPAVERAEHQPLPSPPTPGADAKPEGETPPVERVETAASIVTLGAAGAFAPQVEPRAPDAIDEGII